MSSAVQRESARRRVLLVSSQELFGQTLVMALDVYGVIAEVVSGDRLHDVELAIAHFHPDLVLLEPELRGGLSTLPLVRPISAIGSLSVVLADPAERLLVAPFIEQGAIGVVPRSGSFVGLLAAIDTAAETRSLLSPSEVQELLADLRAARTAEQRYLQAFERLTCRERAVLSSLMIGLSAEQIASRDVVSITTVRTHIRSVLSKLGVSSQLAAVAVAHKTGWMADQASTTEPGSLVPA